MAQGEVIQGWTIGIRIVQISHYRAAAYYTGVHRILGLIVVIFTTLAGTTVFASMQNTPGIDLGGHARLLVGIISVVAAILSAVQTFLSPSELSQKHRTAATKYGAIRLEIEAAQLRLATAETVAMAKFLEHFRRKWCAVEQESPCVPQRFHERARRQVAKSLASQRKHTGEAVDRSRNPAARKHLRSVQRANMDAASEPSPAA